MKPLDNFCIGVAGGISVGKTHLCGEIVRRAKNRSISVRFLSYDRIRREILQGVRIASFEDVRGKLLKEFGSEIISEEGRLHLLRISEIIFQDREAFRLYNEIIDPQIIDVIRSESDRDSVNLVEWPTLVERGLLPLFSGNLILVACSRREQLRRLQGGDLSPLIVRRRLRLQGNLVSRCEILRSKNHEDSLFSIFLSDTQNLDRFCESFLDRLESTLEKLVIAEGL